MIKKLRHIILFFLVLIFVVTYGQSPSPSQGPSYGSVSGNNMSSYILNKDIATKASQTYLSSNVVTAIAQDKNGMMWFGTRRGLNSYDSYSFEEYNEATLHPLLQACFQSLHNRFHRPHCTYHKRKSNPYRL